MIINTHMPTAKETFTLFHRTYLTTEEYKNSIQKDEYEWLYKKDDVDNERTIESGNDFVKFTIFILKEVNVKKTSSQPMWSYSSLL